MELNKISALELLTSFTKSESLLKHARSVEACMLWYANYFKVPAEEQLAWSITGLLHDFDYEQHPSGEPPDGHPYWGTKHLKELGYPNEIITAILGHATFTGVTRDSLLAKTLFAVDELSGLVTASVLVRPDKNIHNLETRSVLKKMRDKAFARGCNRDDIKLGAEELGIDLESHCSNVISALREISEELGLGSAVISTEQKAS